MSRATVDVKELRQLLDAVVAVNAEASLPGVLQRILESATALVDARYGALGVLDPSGARLVEFRTIGMADDTVAAIGADPEGLGILGLLVADPRPIRLADLSAHPESHGFPPNHPPMTTFLGVPIRVRGEVFGNLYLTEKADGQPFTEIDEELAVGLAATAGVAIENSRLHERIGELRVVEDRERIARDLHDTVIQRLFATGLSLQGAAARIDDPALAGRLEQAIGNLDDTVRHIRTTIFELQRPRLPGRSLRQELLDIVDEVAGPAGLVRQVRFDGPIDLTVPTDLGDEVVAVVREAVSNVARHAGADTVTVQVTVSDDELEVRVDDDGCGPGPGAGNGLVNLRRRAEQHDGSSELVGGEQGGSTLTWRVPLAG
ncbi:MAG: GAF domain-containing protein [Acidimicrobiales bacterium]|nr:GAF domain-containing protein [Acidimicrobiales bacterium]